MTDSPAPTPVDELFSVAGKTVVVTGGSRGIGRMIAGGFVAGGADVVIASRKADAVEAAVAELSRYGSCRGLAADLSTEEGARVFADAVAADHDKVHVLVNNAGATWGAPLVDHDTASWDRVLNLNVQGVFHTTKFFLPLLEAASTPDDPSRVINIGSIDGIHVPVLESYSYSSSKAAVHQLTRHLARYLAPSITVNAVAPGNVSTPMIHNDTLYGLMRPDLEHPTREDVEPGMTALHVQPVPWLEPEEITAAVVFLASEGARHITGSVIDVDAGASARFTA